MNSSRDGAMESLLGAVVLAFALLLGFVLHAYLACFGVRGVLRGMTDGLRSRSAAEQHHPDAPELARDRMTEEEEQEDRKTGR